MPTVIISDNTTGSYIGDYSGTEDTELTEISPTTNSYTNGTWYVSSFASGDRRHCTLGFSGISNLPTGLNVSSSTVHLYLNATANSGSSNTIRFRLILVNENETQATWNIYSTGNNWTTAGALSDGNDRSSTTTLDFSPGTTTATFVSGSSAQLATDVETMRSSGIYWWLLSRPTESTYDGYYDQFTSSKAADGLRPALTIVYTTGSALYQRALGRGIGRGICRGL